jgi:hypothetical protein
VIIMAKTKAFDYFELLGKLSKTTTDFLKAESIADIDRAFDNWMVEAISELERNRKNYKTLKEDGLTAVLAGLLRTPEISVRQEENSNGHVDITIRLNNIYPNWITLGEAKVWHGNKYHIQGLNQLLNRYSTGRECRGFVISYVRKEDIKNLFRKLRGYIDDNKPYDLDGLCRDHNIKWSFLSRHKHSSGEMVEVCHVGCNLFV